MKNDSAGAEFVDDEGDMIDIESFESCDLGHLLTE